MMQVAISAKNNVVSEGKANYQLPYLMYEKHIPSIDGLRAFSIVLVIISHIAFNYNTVINNLGLGGFGVNIFFVISGFLITFLTLREKEKTGSISTKNFYIRRVLRIIPVAYLFIFVLFILDYLLDLHLGKNIFLRPLFFSENLIDRPGYTLTRHYWTLSVEEQFYILFPLLISVTTKALLRFSAFLIFSAPITTYIVFHYSINTPFIHHILFFCYHVFGYNMLTIATGCLTAVIIFKFPQKLFFKFRYPTIFQSFLLITAWWFYHISFPAGINNLLSSLCIACFLISIVNNRNNIIFRLLNYRLIRYVGLISYSLYIWQQIFCYDQPWAKYPIGKSIPLNILALFITAMISYHLYEKQFLKLKRKFKAIKTH